MASSAPSVASVFKTAVDRIFNTELAEATEERSFTIRLRCEFTENLRTGFARARARPSQSRALPVPTHTVQSPTGTSPTVSSRGDCDRNVNSFMADEPTAALDRKTGREVVELLQQSQKPIGEET